MLGERIFMFNASCIDVCMYLQADWKDEINSFQRLSNYKCFKMFVSRLKRDVQSFLEVKHSKDQSCCSLEVWKLLWKSLQGTGDTSNTRSQKSQRSAQKSESNLLTHEMTWAPFFQAHSSPEGPLARIYVWISPNWERRIPSYRLFVEVSNLRCLGSW